jgi:prepilin peptidase CpaA
MRSFAWWPTLIVLAIAVFTDLRSRRIPNWLVFPFLMAGIVVSPWRPDWRGNGHGFGWHGFGQCIAGFALGVLIFGFLFWMGGMGAGDVKLSAAIGAWIGPQQLFFALIITSIAGGIMVLAWIFYAKFLQKFFLSVFHHAFGGKSSGNPSDTEMSLDDFMKRKMPYAPAIAIGTFMSFFAH